MSMRCATPSEWYGHTPYCGVMINAMSWTIVALWCGNKWLVVVQPHVVVWSHSILWRDDKCHDAHYLYAVAWRWMAMRHATPSGLYIR
ncbi:hypothetical protein [Segatella oulorum]|uniref:hypothetical protein n=1 Tax=Segatella oulorum TaxID=28136 RepID=UPI0023F3E47C|nr:hypothetical protein [Segatella oulorum]